MPIEQLLRDGGGGADPHGARRVGRLTTKLLRALVSDGLGRSGRATTATRDEAADERDDADHARDVRSRREDRDAEATPRCDDDAPAAGGSPVSGPNSSDDALAREIGLSVGEYLEECFYDEASPLDREKFRAIPEVARADCQITGHLGTGSFCEVLEVIYKGRGSVRSKSTGLSSSGRFALKCLRPQLRNDAETFAVGAEDLLHETALLATLDHKHIIKLHGRSPGRVAEAFRWKSGFFVLLDAVGETLQERLGAWSRSAGAGGSLAPRAAVLRAVVDALSYLHAKRVVFRNLTPTNVGFDARGAVKLFDFQFAIGLPEKDATNPEGLLFDRCGGPRYMAPEMGLARGYSTAADVYSFALLLWEVCALEKPFASITTVDAFEREVFVGGTRPALAALWPAALKELLCGCWSPSPSRRPSMSDVQSVLASAVSRVAVE